MSSRILQSTYAFLEDLQFNNNREWFQANKPRYEAARENVAAFAEELLYRLSREDVLETESGKKSLYRIYRDVRFSKNKAPYKNALSGHFVRQGKFRRGGYYFHFSPNDNMIGGGFYGIEKHDLKRIREELAIDPDPLRAIMNDDVFNRICGGMRGEQLKTAPQGYLKDHPAIDLLRYKQFYAMRRFSKKEVLQPDFIDTAEEVMLNLRPFFNYFSEILTTDANGEVIA